MGTAKKSAALPREREWLNGAERARLKILEDLVEGGIRVGLQTGKALREIRDTRLYRESSASFEAYCKQRFDLTSRRINQFIDAAGIVDQVRTNVPGPAPKSEAVARELGRQRDDPDAMRETWAKAVEQHGDAPTAAQVRAIREPPPPAPESLAGDTRFEQIEAAVSLLKLLPAPDAIVFPTEPGDVEVIGESLDWLAAWAPKARTAWKRHKVAQRHARAVA